MKIVLVGNYLPDRQESMLRFVSVLKDQYQVRQLDVELLHPEPRFARNLQTQRGLGKWLGYLDKFVLFPRKLALRARQLHGTRFVVHVCDHSNASYTRQLACCNHLVTCNDLLAVRSALGEFPENPTRWTGRRLQAMILAGLTRARQVACISQASRNDVLRLVKLPAHRVDLVYMGLNYPYHPMPADQGLAVIQKLFPPGDPAFYQHGRFSPSFLLHVGGNQWYKNRSGLLRIYEALRRRQSDAPTLVLAGSPLSAEMSRFINEHELASSVRFVPAAGNEDLRALYSMAECLVFPSLAEGFGWPIAEAQACGCRVVTTGQAPMTEVGGDTAAVYIDPASTEASADAVARLLTESREQRAARVQSGLANVRRFSTSGMIDHYLSIYQRLIDSGS